MTEIIVDTNIFIRFFLNDEPKLSITAKEIIEGCVAGKYSLAVLPAIFLEIVWLLKSFYKLPKDEIINKIESMFQIPNLKFIDEKLVLATVEVFKKYNVDFVDAFVFANMDGLKIKEIFSFDRDFDKIKGIKRLEKW